jgi:hypothetical protein
MQYRDETTVHYTVFLGGYGIKPDLSSNLIDRPTTQYGCGRFNNGGLWFCAKAPGLIDAPAPDFPGEISSATADDDDRINDWQSILIGAGGYLDRDDAVGGGFNSATIEATKDLQEDADLPATGVVNEATWNAAFNSDVTGYSLQQSHAAPLARIREVQQFLYTPDGARYAENPEYNPDRPPVEEFIDYGVFPKARARKLARARITRLQAAKAWAGTIRLNDKVSIFAGDYEHGDPDPEIVHWMTPMAGKNVMFRGWDGDVLLHIATDSKDENGTTLTVDSMARPALEVRQIVERRREGRQNPGKTFLRQHRGVDLGGIGEWLAEIGGEVSRRVELPEDEWVVFPVIAGDEGQIERVRLQLTETVEFALAIFCKPVTASWVQGIVGNPFDSDGWDKAAVRNALDRRVMLEGWGNAEQPCGYGRKAKTDGGTLSGLFVDQGGLPYRTFSDEDVNNGKRGLLYFAVRVRGGGGAAAIRPQRVIWPAYEVGM